MIKHIASRTFPILVAGTIIFFGIYGASQQVLRQGANSLPIELAENAANALNNGEVPAGVVPRAIVDVSQSLSPFVMVFDEHGAVLESSMKMGNESPVPPAGIFEYVRSHGTDTFTWQPMSGVRLASKMIHFQSAKPLSGGAVSSGFVLAGHNLREVETEYQRIGLALVAGWVLFVIGVLVASWCVWFLNRKK